MHRFVISVVEARRAAARCSASVAGVVLAAMLLVMLAGCGSQNPSPDDAAGTDDEARPVRLITLSPSISQMLVELGVGEHIVGRNQMDAAAPESARVAATFPNPPSLETLLELDPDIIFGQYGEAGFPDGVRQYADEHDVLLINYPHPRTVDDIGSMLLDERELAEMDDRDGPPRSLGVLLGAQVRASKLKTEFLRRLAALDGLTYGRGRPRVLVLYGVNPFRGAGPNCLDHELLTRWLHARNVLGDREDAAPLITAQQMAAELKPDVIILLMPGEPALGPIETDPRLAGLRNMPVPAVENRRIVLINDPLAQLPSISSWRTAASLAKAIYPELASAVDETMHAIDQGQPLPPTPPIDSSDSPVSSPSPSTPDATEAADDASGAVDETEAERDERQPAALPAASEPSPDS